MKNFLLIPLLFLTILSFSQEKNELKPLIQDLITNTLNADYDKVLDVTYPKLFDLISREQMKEMFAQMLTNEQFVIAFEKIDNQIQIGEVQVIDNDKYVWIDYKNAMNIKFNDMQGQDPKAMLGLFESAYPDGKVTWNEQKQRFEILIDSMMLAISDELTHGQWMFLNANTSDKQMLQMILEEKVINELGL